MNDNIIDWTLDKQATTCPDGDNDISDEAARYYHNAFGISEYNNIGNSEQIKYYMLNH